MKSSLVLMDLDPEGFTVLAKQSFVTLQVCVFLVGRLSLLEGFTVLAKQSFVTLQV